MDLRIQNRNENVTISFRLDREGGRTVGSGKVATIIE